MLGQNRPGHLRYRVRKPSFLLWQGLSCAADPLLSCYQMLTTSLGLCIIFQKAFGVSSNFDQYSNLCIISILKFWMMENFPCVLNFPSSKKVLLIIKLLYSFFFVKIIITLGYKFKFYYTLNTKTKTIQEKSETSNDNEPEYWMVMAI